MQLHGVPHARIPVGRWLRTDHSGFPAELAMCLGLWRPSGGKLSDLRRPFEQLQLHQQHRAGGLSPSGGLCQAIGGRVRLQHLGMRQLGAGPVLRPAVSNQLRRYIHWRLLLGLQHQSQPLGGMDPTQLQADDLVGTVICRMVCPDPVPMPRGYWRSNVTGFLECAPGFWGSANSFCSRKFPGCDIETTLFGCYELFPCVFPEIDPCIYDYDPTVQLWGGESLTIQCKRPYRGFQSTAMCPPNNLDATRAFMWFPGDCFCPDPCPIPPGYVKTGPGYDNRVCGQGYTGTSLLHCGSESKCQEVPLLSGCTKAVPCARLPGAQFTSAKWSPRDNGDENAQPILQGELNCILDSCNATDEIPVGYVKTHDGWRCDEGYGGTPAVHCGFSPAGAFQGGRGCGFEMHPSGCKPLVPCVPPSSLEGCKYDTSSCGSVVPGQECQLKCRKPYSGLGVFAACPGDNTDPTQEVILPVGSFLDCDCPAPAPEFVPAGYMQNTEGDWVCGPGFAGTAVKRCERPDTCLDEPEFLGCFPLKPCIIPDVDTCMFDLSDCVNVMPGETCSIYCVPPYKQDQVQNATCRLGNIDPLQPIEWEIGRCDLDWEDCKDPLPLPVGYEKRSDGFHCAAGYVGAVEVSPTVHCGPWANCDSTPKLTGCFPLESCRPVRFDDCAYNTSQCPYDFKPGQECQVTCKAPYVGPPSVARCSSNNIDWQGAFEWVASECFCPNPRTVPEGYFQNASGWFCDTNNSYTGEAEVVCSQPGFCLAEPMVIGCQKSGPCVAPLLDHCMFDASSCDGVEIARQCVISCAAGFIGASTTAFCENPGGQFGLQYTEPSCRLDFCPDPAVMPGYLWNTSGWFCADGFEGSAQKLCSHDGSCAVYSWLSGCTPIRTPCSLPALGCRYDVSNCSAITPGEYCEVKCAAPFAGTPSRAVCAPVHSSEGRPGGPSSPPEELLLTLPYCDLEGCPDPDPIPVGYQRVGEIFTCTEGFVGQAIMQCRETQPCEHVLTLSGCTNATEIAISLAQLIEAPSQRDFSPCQAGEACGEPDDVSEGYDKFLGEWRCSVDFAGSAGIQCSARRNCQSTPTLSGCVPIEACLPIIADGCDIDVSDCTGIPDRASDAWHAATAQMDPYTGPSTYGTCPEGNINTSEVLTWSRPQCALTNCPQGLVVQDGYIKDSILGWICANGFKGDASVNCSINDACEAECVYGGCHPIEVCQAPPIDACRFNWTDCDGILPGRSCYVSCMPPYLGQRTMANCRATVPLGPNLTSTSPPELDWTPPICQCPEASPAPGYTRVIDAPEETWQCDEEFGGSAAKRCQRPLECLDAPELFGCLPLQPCVPPISTARCEPLDMSNCSEVPPGESCEVRCVPPFVGAPSIASCPAENLILNQVLTMPVEPCVLGCKDPPVHPGYQKRGEDWRCDREDRFNGTANVFCELDESCDSMKKFEGCIPTTRPCLAPPLDLCQYDVSDCLSVAPNSSCFIGCAGNYAGQPVEAMCPEGNVQDNGLKFTAPRCVAEEIDCPLPAVLPTGYKLDGRDVVCEDDYVGSFVSHRCGHDAQCNKVLELTGCVKPVKCSPLKIEPCERDNLGCWDVEAGGSCSIGCKPPFFGPSSLASCPAGNTDPTTPLEFDLISCLCSDPPVIPDGYSQDIFGQWSCDPGYAGTAEARCRVGETCIADSELVGCEKLEPCRDLTPTSCDQDVSDCTDVQPGGTCFVTCRQPWTSIESTLGTCPDDNVDPMRTVTWTHPTCELRCPAPNPMPDGFVWDEATRTASCKEGYLGPASTVCIVNNMTCEVTTFVSGCQKLMPCLLPPVDPCRVNMTQCRDVMPGESCRPRCIQPFELYGPAALARCPENNLLPDAELQWLQFPNCSVFECEDPSPVPAGYAFGINENDPVAVGHGIPRWYCAPGYVGIAERVCSGNATCGVVAFLSGCLPIIACRAPVVDTCRVDDSRCGSIRPGSRCTLSCRPPFVGAQTVASCSVRNTEPDGLLFRSPICTLPSNFDPIPLDTGFSSTYEGYRCGVGYAGRIQTVCRMQAGCRTTTYPVGCAPPVPCKVGNFQDEDGRGGFIAGNISFGRAQLDTMLNAGQARDFRSNTPLRFSGKGTIYEDEIDSYDVYFVDSCNRTLGNALTSVAIKDATDQILCCDETVYNISLVDLRMTEEVKGLAVIARIRNSLGLEPSVNYWVVTIEDRIDPITNAAIRMTQTAVVSSNAEHRHFCRDAVLPY
ncbi:unnamed protein product [Cladocopium goreaui]|uniref:Uncharacterized protein n=1 Tax=Cladocopium goreaui TaxID=2562237 RepID=A0A9P1FZN9_9DINO|nr:unnamed protein product [Cladocopium goreaui]